MKKILFTLILLTTILQTSCIERNGYYTEGENSIIALICDITWMSKKTIDDEGSTYQNAYDFDRNGTYTRKLIVTDKNGKIRQSSVNGRWAFSDPSSGIIYFGYNNYWDIEELTEKKFAVYVRIGEFGQPGMTREYSEFTPKKEL